MDRSLRRYWLACVFGAVVVTFAIYCMAPTNARSEPITGQSPAISSITIELKRDRRRSPKFLKVKQRKEPSNAAAEKPNG